MNKIVLIVGVGVLIVLMNSVYIVRQTEQALVLQFGEFIKEEKEPGLKFKVPFVQDVYKFDTRILELNAQPREFVASDLKKVIIDSFAKYRIVKPLLFHQRVRDESGIRRAVSPILESRLREEVGTVPLTTLLTKDRIKIMNDTRDKVNEEVKDFGIEMVDVRIMRADLPDENSQFVYREMRTAREREAKEYRAQGAEESQFITAKAEKERTILLAEAKKKSQIIRGEGEAEATRVTGEAFGQDKEFYSFYRSMEAYRNTISKNDTSLVLSPNSEFLKFFGNRNGHQK